jgi:8-hydroxy-5-deazaflavin:NADPH oxidoreductase
MRVGIIGAGKIGGTLARKLAALGHQVRVANSQGPASLAALAMSTGARAVSVEDAVRDVEQWVQTLRELQGVTAP